MLSTALCLFALIPQVGDGHWMGMYLQDKKVGYTHYSSWVGPDGSQHSRSESVIDGKMLGYGLSLKQTTKVDLANDGKSGTMDFVTVTGGKTQKVVATFDATSIKAVSEMDGRKSEKTLPRPESGLVVDDPVNALMGADPVSVRVFYIFDPNTLELVKCEPKLLDPETVQTPLGETQLTVVDVNDPRAPMKLYFSAKGDLVKATGPFGLEMRSVTKDVALMEGERVDIAFASALKTDREIPDSTEIKHLKLKVTGADLSKLPSDQHQTVTKTEDGWAIDVHPVQPSERLFTESPSDDMWLAADVHIPSDQASFKALAARLTQGKKTMLEKAEAIRQFVLGKIRANAGIGVLRDAEDVLDTGEGVCRDHAILMATLLRAAGIPTKLASGIVYYDGAFYYHAWVEVWTGQTWLGLDSTRGSRALDATHVKIGQGTVGAAFTSFLLDGAQITVIDP